MPNATPAHYSVEKTGPRDPENAAYFVVDVVNDLAAREAIAYLGRKYEQRGQKQLSRECFDLLDATVGTVGAIADARYPKKGNAKKDIGRD